MRNGGLRQVAYVGYWSRIVAVDILLRCSLLSVNVFPFPPSKEKLIGDVPMNRQHAAFPFPCLPVSIYWRNAALRVNRQCGPNLLRLYLRIIHISRIFFPVSCASPNNAGRFGEPIGNEHYKRKNLTWNYRIRFAYSWSYRLLVLVYMTETEIHQRKDDGKNKSQINRDRHGPVPVPNNRHLPHPPWFS